MNHDFSSVDRRINYLRNEIYTYDKFLRNPTQGQTDMATQAKFAMDADDYQQELDELVTLREIADKAKQPTSIKTWQAALLAFYSTVAIVIAVLSLWMVAYGGR